eukprot:1928610-Prorocentrum_lima.AAC.1
MTSSLVGSEMCIRDRFSDDRQEERVETCKEGRGGGTPLLEAILCNEAVSYTHLTLPTICSV